MLMMMMMMPEQGKKSGAAHDLESHKLRNRWRRLTLKYVNMPWLKYIKLRKFVFCVLDRSHFGSSHFVRGRRCGCASFDLRGR